MCRHAGSELEAPSVVPKWEACFLESCSLSALVQTQSKHGSGQKAAGAELFIEAAISGSLHTQDAQDAVPVAGPEGPMQLPPGRRSRAHLPSWLPSLLPLAGSDGAGRWNLLKRV